MTFNPNLEPSPNEKESPLQRFETLAERLNSVRQRQFVGRGVECAIFKAALSTAGSPFAVLYLHGPGGVGKNPDWSAELHRRARAFYVQRLQQARGLEQQRILIEETQASEDGFNSQSNQAKRTSVTKIKI